MKNKQKNFLHLFFFLCILLIPSCSSQSGSSGNGSPTDNTPPTAPGIPLDEGHYTEVNTIWLNWAEAADSESGISGYRLEVKNQSDAVIFDSLIGNVLNYKVSGTEGDTLTARVAAINGEGLQGDWSAVSDGITLCGQYAACLSGTLFVSTAGDDNNDGLFPSTPFLTINKAVSVAGPGDVIDVAAGTYKEQVMILQSNGHGGDSAAPLLLRGNGTANIDGSEVLSPWTDLGIMTSGTAPCHLWSTPFNPDNYAELAFQDGIKRAPTQLFIDGTTRLDLLPEPASFNSGDALTEVEVRNEALLASQLRPNTWAWIESSNEVKVCLAEGDPITDHVIEIPVRNAAIVSDAGYLHVSGFITKRQSVYGIVVKGDSTTKEVVIANNRVSFVSGSREYRDSDLGPAYKVWENGIGIGASVEAQASIISNHVSDISYAGIKFARAPSALTEYTYMRVADNIVERITPHPYGVSREHESGEALAGSNGSHYDLIENNTISDTEYGIWLDSAFDSPFGGTGYATVSENNISNTHTAIFFERAAHHPTAMRNLITNTKFGIQLGTSFQYTQEADPSNPLYDVKYGRVVNNTIIDAEIGINISYASHAEVFNNIVYSSKVNAIGTLIREHTITINDASGNSYGTVNNNLYHLTASDKPGCWMYLNVCFSNMSSWYDQSGFDMDSIDSDPLFSNLTGGDYSLAVDSPARDSGTDAGLSDYCNRPDIGYAEFLTGACL
ncbi:MAG: DUF1565 domain-containing protein [Deltaproteobacteria bacterium]|nr:DUF1565 domain-containing protein [Deltaproteobacteria bacterium]